MDQTNFEMMKKRLNYSNANNQQQRMIRDKKKTLDRAIKYSYQGALVSKLNEKDSQYNVLINRNKNTFDYDEKILSADYTFNFQIGDIIIWHQQGIDFQKDSKWLIYLQEDTELSYFRGNIRQCNYSVNWEENGEKFSTDLAIIGPSETTIDNTKFNQTIIDEPNLTLTILAPADKDTIKFFKRYERFYLKDRTTCWRVQAINDISTPGIIKITAKEDYSNTSKDDIAGGIVDGLIIDPIDPNSQEVNDFIIGESFIQPKITYYYQCVDANNCFIDNKNVIFNLIDDNHFSVKWNSLLRGTFIISCHDVKKIITVYNN